MFTGIIEEVGTVGRRSGAELAIQCNDVLDGLCTGDSVSIDGACMTVVESDETSFMVQVSPESFACTALGELKEGDAVNLERAMAVGDRFGGHFVLGHVDAVGHVLKVEEQGEFQMWTFFAPPEIAQYLVPKGSVTLDGISLTVVSPTASSFSVAIIPETLRKTKLSTRGIGDPVNLEADVIGKHILHYMQGGASSASPQDIVASYGAKM